MKRTHGLYGIFGVSLFLTGLLFGMPLAVIEPFPADPAQPPPPAERPQELAAVSGELDRQTVLKVLDGEQVVEMDLGEYLTGVVRAEMPASFATEALKAQTVAARTYTLYKLQSGGNHGDAADICTNPACCQAYISKEAARANWGAKADEYEEKVENAVHSTDGETILYGGVPILAVFHSASSGLTRASGQVWTNDLPYLQAVSSPEPKEKIPNYYSRAEFSTAEFKKQFSEAYPEADFSGKPSQWLGSAVVDEAGSVDTLLVGGVKVKGSRLRGLLGLRSACFEWEVQGDTLVFYVRGYGHGVGLSQYGANEMAKQGANYREILTHYYTGVEIEPYLPG